MRYTFTHGCANEPLCNPNRDDMENPLGYRAEFHLEANPLGSLVKVDDVVAFMKDLKSLLDVKAPALKPTIHNFLTLLMGESNTVDRFFS
jgi:hypothetical protein